METLTHWLVVWGLIPGAHEEDEEGLSQSTETAILVAAAVMVAMLIVVAVRAFVTGELGKLGTR